MAKWRDVVLKIPELRDALQGRSADDLRLITVELYRRIPKKIIEEKNLDHLIQDPQEYLAAAKRPKPVELPDVEYLAFEVEQFVSDALQQYYFAPNSFIHKSERPKWRFHVKRFHRELMSLMADPEARVEVSRLLDELFELMCYAEEVILFSSQEPFESIGIPKDSFFRDVIRAQRAAAADHRWIRQAVETLLRNARPFGGRLIRQLVAELTTNPLREEGLRTVVEVFKDRPTPRARTRKAEPRHQTEHLAELALRICLAMKEYDRGIAFYLKHNAAYNDEVAVYILLSILREHHLPDLWLREYEAAIRSGVPLRDGLRREYKAMKAENQ